MPSPAAAAGASLASAWVPVVERLEDRRLFAANIDVSHLKAYFNDPITSGSNAVRTLTIANTGTSPLALPSDAFTIGGTNAARFTFVNKPSGAVSIAPGASLGIQVKFSVPTQTTMPANPFYNATLAIKSSDADTPLVNVALKGLATAGAGGQNEPSLQRLFDFFDLPIRTGDANPDNTDLFSDAEPLGALNDEVFVQRVVKSGAGPVTIQVLSMFGVSGSPAVKFGTYKPGTPGALNQLFTVPTGDAQSVQPTPNGTTSFDPGADAFGFYSTWPWPTFKNGDGSVRTIYSEDALNREEATAANRRKVRFYQLRSADGSVVPDAYVVAMEEFTNDATGAYDNQDIVFIVRNVRPAAAAPVIGVQHFQPTSFPDRLVFSRIETIAPDPNNPTWVPNDVHDETTLRINNTGSQPLTISGITIAGRFALVTPFTGPVTVTAGSFLDVRVRFTLTASELSSGALNAVRNGTLTITSNDPARPTTAVQLSGQWQSHSERNARGTPGESSLKDFVTLFGYATNIPTNSGLVAAGNSRTRFADEILSGYWRRAEGSQPVKVTQLAAFHTQGQTERIQTHLQGSTSTSTVFVHDEASGQSILPLINGGSTIAAGTVSSSHASGAFGFRVQNLWSDDARNPQDTPGGQGHFLRFFVARDRAGKIIANTYILVMDYLSTDAVTGANTSNFDYQDNIYLVENVKPASGPAVPTGATATGGAGGISLDWADNAEPNVAGYNVYRSDAADGTYAKVNADLLTASAYLDATAPAGATSYYRIVAVDVNGTEGAAASVFAARAGDIVPPAAPTGLIATPSLGGIGLDWANNGEADLLGYNVYRATSADGTYVKINASLLTGSDFLDTTAPVGAASDYRVVAVDASGNESAAATVSATRPAPDTTAPAAPTGLDATGSTAGIALDWLDNVEGDLAGYNVYRAMTAGGTYGKVNGALLTASAFLDIDAPEGATSYYRVTAVDAGGNESPFATASATRPAGADTTPPAAPTALTATGSQAGIALDWADSPEGDVVGYRVYRGTSASGAFVQVSADLVSASAFTDTTAPAGATSYYRVVAVDAAGNVSPFATITGARPAATAPSVIKPIRVNFQLNGSPLVAQYNPDHGRVYGDRGNGLTYGWNVDHTSLDRDRNRNSDQRLDTLVQMKKLSSWTIAVPNGWYDVRVVIGDSQYASIHTIKVNGLSYWKNLKLGANKFGNLTRRVQVVNGKLVINNGDSPELNTRINFVEITRVVGINFQLDGSPSVAGYSPDSGLVYGDRGNGLTFGWNDDHAHQDRDRNRNANQLLDTLVQMESGARWTIDLPNGKYSVTASVGDSQFASIHTLNVNGASYFNRVSLAANVFQQKTLTVTVANGKLVIDNGASSNETTRINYLEIRRLS